MRKNENKTFKFLNELLTPIAVEREVRLNKVIIDAGEIIRYYTLIDFAFTLNGQLFYCEFNGQQHYKPVKKWAGKEGFRKQQIRDEWLRSYCKSNNIHLIEIDGRKIRGKKIKAYLKRNLKPFLKINQAPLVPVQ